IDTLSQRYSSRRKRGCIKFLCDYFGITRQGYYKHVNRHLEVDILTTSIVLYCKELLELMPKAGMRELYACCVSKFGPKMVIGRDRCYDIFRSNGLCQRTSRKRPKTTNSNHNYYIYPDLLNVAPKFVATRLGAMVVADITYVNTGQGWAYLSLLTDASSRAIVGYALYKTLETEGPLKALEMAISFYEKYHIDMSTLIHHSDRGVQYCSNKYVERLKEHQINISMTQCGDPLHNALAERMNNTIKNGWLFDCDDESFEQVSKRIEDAVYVYNHVRPHQGINMRTPMEVVSETGGLTA
ncbi:IS3 family transposase, partial [Bacteroides thetaiotaomicron]